MRKGKRILSILLAVAMVITGVNIGALAPVEAAERSQSVTLQAERFEGSGSQSGNEVLIATTHGESSRNGDNSAAAFRNNVTANKSDGGLGSSRIGALQFDVSQFTSIEEIDEAVLTIHVNSTNQNLGDSWTKAGIFQTENNTDWSVSKDDQLGSGFPAIGADYSYDATIWSKENIAKNNTGAKTFDVTNALKAAITAGNPHMVLRLQTVTAGFLVAGFRAANAEAPANVPTIVVSTSKKSTATVKYLNKQNSEIKEAKTIELVKVGSPYTYEIPDDEKRITTESGIYVYDEMSNAAIADVKEDAAQNVINLTYNKAELSSVIAPSTIYAIEGNEPILPRQLMANTNIEGVTLPVNVTWDVADKKWTVGDNTVTGTAEGLAGEAANVSATVHIYECDEAVADMEANNSSGKIKFKNGYKGIIETEYDIVKTGTLGSPCAIEYYDQGMADDAGANWWCSTSTRFNGGKFFVNGGNGKGGDGNASGSKDFPEEANRTIVYDGEKVYRVRTQIDTTSVSVEGDTTTGNGTYRVWVTDPEGNTAEVTDSENPMTSRAIKTGIIDKVGVMNAGFKIVNHKISWQSGYATVQINYQDPAGQVWTDFATSMKELPGSTKTIDTSIFTPKSVNGKTYLFDADNSGWDTNGDGSADTAATDSTTIPAAGDAVKYIAKYKAAELLGTDETVEVETLVGKAPILPLTLEAKYENVEGTIPTEVTWNLEGVDLNTETADNAPLEITGTFPGGKTITAKVHVKHAYLLAKYTFDGDTPAADSTGRHADAVFTNVEQGVAGVDAASKGVKLKGGSNGSSNVKLPDDLLQLTEADGSKTTQDDFTVSMFINRESNGNSFAMTLHATQVGKPDPLGHLGFINRDDLVDMEYRIGGKTVANLQAKDAEGKNLLTPIGQWSHVAIVTNGSKDTAKLYLDGVLVGTATGIINPSRLVAQNNYLGRASWGDNDYKATFDDFEVYNGILTEEEIQEIANDRLCSAPVQDIYDNLELSLQSGEELDKTKITEALNLPTTVETSDGKTVQGLKISWESSNPAIRADGTVVRPSKGKGDAANITLKAKIQYGSSVMIKTFSGLTVLELDGVSFVEFNEAYEKAKGRYISAKKENIYTSDSLAALKAKVDAAEQIKATEGTPDEDADAVDAATAELLEAVNVLVLKTFKQMDEALAAWYPLDDSTDKAKDASSNGLHGVTAESVTFSREDGATFNGGSALKNVITLPNELEVGEQMTFAFWAKDARGAKSNAFGIGSGDGFGDNKKTDAHFFYVNTNDGGKLVASMNPKYWSGAVNISTEAAAQDTWHHIVCVLNGTNLTLYVNGELVGTKDVAHSVKEMWDADPNTRAVYIGNCSYGKNPNGGDSDYKGSIKDFRIYNASLAQEQVAGVYNYINTLPMKYAKDDLMKTLGARVEEDGTVILNVTNLNTTDKVFTLPAASYGDAKVTWESSDNEVINADTGAAAVPDSKEEPAKTADLTATITLGEGDSQETETIVFKCRVYFRNNTDTTALEAALKALEDKRLKQQDYTQASWTLLHTAIKNAQDQVDNPDDEQTVAAVKSALEDAESKLVNIAGLRDKVEALISEMEELTESDYSTASWKALQDKIEAANEVLGTADATKTAVDAAIATLPETAASALKVCGSKEPLENAIAAAEALEKYQTAYTEASWEKLTAALQTAKAELAKRLEDYAPAADELKSVMAALEVKEEHKLGGTVKEELDKKLAEAKEEALTSSNYTPQTWGEYKAALNALEEILNRANATKGEAEDAAKALEDARAALKPVAAQIPDEQKKQEFSAEYETAVSEAANKKPEDYTQESWNRYQKALAAMKKISDRLAEENNNVTKAEIDSAIAEMNTAKAGLVINVDKTALNKAISDCAILKAADYTPESWNAFQAALNAAKAVAAKADATQQEVNNALATLNAKKAALQKAQTQTPPSVKVKKIALSADSKNIAAGKKVTVKAAITPSNAANKKVTWKSSNTKWATVSGKGVVTTKKAGAGKTVTITATAKDGSNVKGTIKIKIMKNAVTKITLKAKSKKVKAGKKVTVKAAVKTNGKKVNKKLTWKSSNTKWATVNSKGVVTTKKAGKGKTVTITAASTDGTKKSAKVKIKIVK